MSFTPEEIERFRSIGLSLDASGHLWHQGSEVTHPGLRQAILRWLDVRADGKDIVRLDDTRYAYIDVAAEHLRATSARWNGERIEISLDDGSTEELDYATLTAGADDGLRCRVRGGTLRARLSTAAQQVVLERVEAGLGDGADGSEPVLQAAGTTWPIRTA